MSEEADENKDLVSPNFEQTNSFEIPSSLKWDTSHQGLTYVAGYVAQKFKLQCPNLGSKTSEFPLQHESSTPWLFHLSRGGLTVPNDAFLESCKGFEDDFNAFHGNEVDRGEKVIKRFGDILCHKYGKLYPEDVLRFFSKVRTFIRIKALNYKMHVQAEKVRSLKQSAQHQV